jgi:hypothetical protein
MNPKKPDDLTKIDEVAGMLDDAQTSVDELADTPPEDADTATIERLKKAIGDGKDAVDDLADSTR